MRVTSKLSASASGLHQLAAPAQRWGGELSAAAASSPLAVSVWQANAGAVNIACAAARKDLAVMATRMDASAAKFVTAGVAYTANEETSAGALQQVVP
ncbi:hypothetical protein [Mycobacterium sp.]|uniref:hypothetical protein n=1 Tax=Mycobacterium sp. TaxID=1785 RepID=UPI003D6C4760